MVPGFQTFSLQNCEKIHLCCLKPPGLRSFVTAAPGNYYNHQGYVCRLWAGDSQGWSPGKLTLTEVRKRTMILQETEEAQPGRQEVEQESMTF